MEETIKNFLERTTVLGTVARLRRRKRFEKKFTEWKKKGSILPMPHFGKQQVVAEYAEKFAPPVFIETGTYTGHMVYAMINKFEEIYSIELDNALAQKAKKKFAGYRHVHIIQGESDQILPEILKNIQKPCLFWLDAHWSGGPTARGELETPIIQELKCILNHPGKKNHILLIDDARCFTGQNDYPTLRTLEQLILDTNPDWVFKVKDDIISVHASELVKHI
jgi:hypothetical protein